MSVSPNQQSVNAPDTSGLLATAAMPQRWPGAPVNLESAFAVEAPEPIRQFLRENPFMEDVLWTAREQLGRYFGDASLALRLSQYPEEATNELLLLVRTSLPASEALSILDRFDTEWWLDALPLAQYKLTIKLEYV